MKLISQSLCFIVILKVTYFQPLTLSKYTNISKVQTKNVNQIFYLGKLLFQISICTADGEPPVCEKIEKCSKIPHNAIVDECNLNLNANKKAVKIVKESLCDDKISKSRAKWILENIIIKVACAPPAIFQRLKEILEKCQVSECDVYQLVVNYIQATIVCGDVAFNSVCVG